MLTLFLLSLFALRLPAAQALSSWYTAPGSGAPTGSTPGDKVRGVNLGGWLILENWMYPTLFNESPLDQYNVLDEWHYCAILGKDECASRLNKHWDSYLTEDDFARFVTYSLNTVRIPIGYWAWTALEDYEPYVQGQAAYLDRALNWAHQYGLDVMIDMHGIPGGQNGEDNQGIKGPIQFTYNQTNMDRALAAMKNMTSYVTDPRFNGVVKAIELLNEPYIKQYSPNGMTYDQLADYYLQAYQAVRSSEHIAGGAHEVMVVIHDAFQPITSWASFFSNESLALNWTNYAVDSHLYDVFGPGDMDKTWQQHLDTMCALSAGIKEAQTYYPVITGEFSLGITTYCNDYRICINKTLQGMMANLTDAETSLFYRQFWEVQQEVFELGAGWIFWAYQNEFAAPWSWSQSAAQNWIPLDPNEKLYPFDSNATAGCLNIANPLTQDMPIFPNTTNAVSNINITAALNKYGSGSASSTPSSSSVPSSAELESAGFASATLPTVVTGVVSVMALMGLILM